MKILLQLKELLFMKRRYIFVAGFITAGFVLRLYGLGSHDLWFDEAFTVNKTRIAPFTSDLLSTGLKLSWDAPLYYLLMRLWLSFCSLFNPDLWQGIEWIMRFPSALFSSAMLVLFYLFARRLFNNRMIVLLSLFFLTASPFHLWYAQEARPYALSVLLTLLSTHFFYAFLTRGDTKSLAGYISSATISLYTDYMSIVLVAAYAVFSAFQSRQRTGKVLAALSPFCFFLPWVYLFLKRFLFVRGGFCVPLPAATSLLFTAENFIVGYNGTVLLYRIADFLVLYTAIMLCLKWKAIKERNELFFCILLSVMPVIVFFVGARFCSVYLDRLLIICTPYFYLLIAWAVVRTRHKGMRVITTMAVMITIMIAAFRYYNNEMYMPAQVRHHMGTYLKKPVRPLVRFLADNFGDHDYLWWGNVSCAFPFCVYVNYLPEYRIRYALAECMCIPYPSFLDERESPRKRFRQRAFFVFAPGIINTSFKRSYTHAIFRKTIFYISLEDALARLEHNGGKLFFLGYDWARSGSLDENSSRLKEFLDSSFFCKEENDFDGIHLYVYEVRGK